MCEFLVSLRHAIWSVITTHDTTFNHSLVFYALFSSSPILPTPPTPFPQTHSACDARTTYWACKGGMNREGGRGRYSKRRRRGEM